MISAKKALSKINTEIGTTSDFAKLREINKMIKAASKLGQNKVVLTYMTNSLMDVLYDKGYRIYKVAGTIKEGDYTEKLPLYVIQWKNSI